MVGRQDCHSLGHEGMVGRKCAFRGVLELTWSDGTSSIIGSDTENWKAGIAGTVKHAAIFDGEVYDARELPGYECVEKLGTPEVNEACPGQKIWFCQGGIQFCSRSYKELLAL